MNATPSEWDRGHAAGETEERLRGHDQKFDLIAEALTQIKADLARLTLEVQRLGDAAASDRATVISTAAALKDAEEARRAAAETRWSPLARVGLAIGILAAIASVIAIVVANL